MLQYFLSSPLGSVFHCLIILTKNECKKQFTLADGYLNLNEWFEK